MTYQTAMNIAERYSVPVLWDSQAKVPYIRYGDGRQIWFENRQSLSYKLELVQKYQLGGISLWRLGQEDPGSWRRDSGHAGFALKPALGSSQHSGECHRSQTLFFQSP